MSMSTTSLPGGTWTLGDSTVTRFGYGAMQLAGPWEVGPPADHDGAVDVLRQAVQAGITHIDTSGAYGPHVTNELIRKALHPYPASLFIATKVGADRDAQGGWPTARRPGDLRRQVQENLQTLGVDTLDLVNMRMGDAQGPQSGSDRKSTRLNSSHANISYDVFCLKKLAQRRAEMPYVQDDSGSGRPRRHRDLAVRPRPGPGHEIGTAHV